MSIKESNLVWLKDLVDNLRHCHRQLVWAENEETVRMVTERMLRDLESCRKLCQSLQQRFRYLEAT